MKLTSFAIRTLDLIAGILLLIVFLIPILLIALAIVLDDNGAPLFRQQRVGKGCRIFTIYKFRTMRVDLDGRGAGVIKGGDESLEEAANNFRRTEPGDKRITRIGAILRPSHLDEIPQLLNILAGHMSFVGVRPDTPAQQADYSPEYWRSRHRHKPGLSGPAQLRSDPLDFSERQAEELKWLENCSMGQYLSILFRTVAKVFNRSSF